MVQRWRLVLILQVPWLLELQARGASAVYAKGSLRHLLSGLRELVHGRIQLRLLQMRGVLVLPALCAVVQKARGLHLERVPNVRDVCRLCAAHSSPL